MKMLVIILQDEDAVNVSQALLSSDLCVNRIASTGGFLRQGTSTLMVGVEDDKVDRAIQIINDNCSPTIEPILKRASLFIINVEQFEQL